MNFILRQKLTELRGKTVILSNGIEFKPDAIFLAAGRAPNTEIEGLDKIGIAKNGRFIAVDENLKTNIDNIYAIGDVTGILPLAHVASHHGVKTVENMLLNKPVRINYNAVPRIIYGNPEIASVGMNEQELIGKNIPYKVSIFPMSAIGKSIVEDEIEGFVKVLADDCRILGVHIVASQASGMIQQAAIAINSELCVDDIKEAIFAHPTNSEALYEAFLGIDGLPIHLPYEHIK